MGCRNLKVRQSDRFWWNQRPSEEDSDERDEIEFVLSEQKKRDEQEIRNVQRKFFYFSPSTGTFPKLTDKDELTYSYMESPFDHSYHGSLSEAVEEEAIEKYKIVRRSKKPRLDGSLSSKIFRFLSKSKRPNHINDIILHLKRIKALDEGTYHTYSIVYRTITRNNHLFIRSGKATFGIRNGFSPGEKKQKEVKISQKEDVEEDVSLKKLISISLSELTKDGKGSPSEVFDYLRMFGYNGTYKNIYSTLQSADFKKNGLFNYVQN